MRRIFFVCIPLLAVVALMMPACKKSTSPTASAPPPSNDTATPIPPASTPTVSATRTDTWSPTPSLTTTPMMTPTPTPSPTPTFSNTPAPSDTFTDTPTQTGTPTESDTPTQTGTPTPTATACSGFLFGWTDPGSYSMCGSALVACSVGDLPSASTVSGVGFYLKDRAGSDPGRARVALYSDNGSRALPGTLLVQSGAVSCVAGWNLVPLPPTALSAGSYWLVVQYNGGLCVGFTMNLTASDLSANPTIAFDSGLPSDASGWGVYAGTRYSLYAVTCGAGQPTYTPTPTKTFTPTATPTFTPTSTPRSILLTFGQYGTGNGKFRVPSAVAVDASGNVYVADSYQSTVQKFNSSGNFVLSWAIPNDGSGTYNFLADLAVDSSQNINVVEQGYNIIQTFSPTGTLLATHGSHGNCCGAFTSPRGIAMDGVTIFVADHDNSFVQKFTTAWVYSSAFNGAAYGVVSGGGDQVYITQPESDLIKQLGGYYKTCGGTGSGNGQLNQPHGIAMDGSGRIYVADTGNNRIEIFSPASGQTAPAYLDQIPLYLNTNSPYDVTLDASGNIYVADTANYRVLKFGPL